MAATEPQLVAGRRLARDLRAIRREHGIDRKEVLDATRVADDVIDQLEKTALIGHPAFNRVYLRSLLVGYAAVLRISSPDIVTALEEVLDGNYTGSLQQKYLNKPDEVVPREDPGAKSRIPGDRLEQLTGSTLSDSTPRTTDETHLIEDKVTGADNSGDGDVKPAPDAEAKSEKESGAAKNVRPSENPAKNKKTPESAGPLDDKRILLPNMSGFAISALVGIVLIAVIWFSVNRILSLSASEVTELVAPDTSQVIVTPEPERTILPDSFSVDIIARTESLDPIRVILDTDFRRPHWVEHLDTLTFTVHDKVVLEREVNHTSVLVDRFLIPEAWLMETGPIELSRSRVQSWLDSLTTAGSSPTRFDSSE